MIMQRVPLWGHFTTRENSLSKDQRFKNCFPEKVATTISTGTADADRNANEYLVTKRPGLGTHLDTSSKTVTFTNATNVVDLTAHGYVDTQTLTFSTTGALPAELTAGTTYFIVSANANDFQVSLTSGGAAVTFTDDGSATNTANFVVQGRGIHGWSQDGKLYSVIGDRIFANTTDLNSAGRLNNSTGIVRFSETRAATPVLVIQDGNTLWTVNAAGTVVEVVDADFPSAIVGGVTHLDTYTFVMTPDGAIYHSDANDVTSWNATAFLTCQVGSDKGVAITTHKNYIVGFGEWTTEFFYNAGNASGSVLDPQDAQVLDIGCAAANSVWTSDETVVWVAQGKQGGRSVAMLNGVSPTIISSRAIEKQLEREVDLTDCYAFGMHIAGHTHYCLTLKTTGITIAFDLRDLTWWELTSDVSDTETYFTGIDATALLNKTYILDEDNGKVYDYDLTNYQDVAETIKVEVVTNPLDFGIRGRKFMHRLSVTGDQAVSTDNLTIDWSDDNYQTWGTSRTLDMSAKDPRLTALGSYTRGRAFRIKHTSALPMRLNSLEFGLDGGDYSV